MNARVARRQVASLPAGYNGVPANWLLCHDKSPGHPMPYPPGDVCSACCPPDPQKPTVGMPVIVTLGVRRAEGAIFSIWTGGFEVKLASGSIMAYKDTEWLKLVEPDFTKWPAFGKQVVGSLMATKTLPAPASPVAAHPNPMPRVNGCLDVSKCCNPDCGYPNPYPADNGPNCNNGWLCSRCKIVKDMQ